MQPDAAKGEIRRLLRALDAPLTIRGSPASPKRFVAIVGSRKGTPPAMSFTRSFAAELARRRVVVGSGGAIGIDTAAHEGALAGGGATYVLRPTGLEVPYPEANRALFDRVAESVGSANLSLFPAHAPSHQAAFRQRNHALVLLAGAVVVVQARFKSGSLNTASWARKLGRPLFVVPGAPWEPMHEGCNALLEKGARPLVGRPDRAADVVLRALSSDVGLEETASPSSRSQEEMAILATLGDEPLSIDRIALKLHATTGVIAAALLTLTLEGVVVEAPFQHYRRA